jgi:hypothetical protein
VQDDLASAVYALSPFVDVVGMQRLPERLVPLVLAVPDSGRVMGPASRFALWAELRILAPPFWLLGSVSFLPV